MEVVQLTLRSSHDAVFVNLHAIAWLSETASNARNNGGYTTITFTAGIKEIDVAETVVNILNAPRLR